jgi:hypothetical protein
MTAIITKPPAIALYIFVARIATTGNSCDVAAAPNVRTLTMLPAAS